MTNATYSFAGLLIALLTLVKTSEAFVSPATRRAYHLAFVGAAGRPSHQAKPARPPLTPCPGSQGRCSLQASSKSSADDCFLSRVPPDLEGIPIPFVETSSTSKSGGAGSFIECYADSMATCYGQEYTIGVPCDYAVALCYYDDDEQLVPVELDDPVMDDVFPVAEAIVAEEFGEELVLQRTPQTLTLVGELEEDEEEEFEEDHTLSAEDDEDEEEDEEVEVLLTFEHRDREYNLVRLLDPILLVGRQDPDDEDRCLLLTTSESDKVMPVLEELFLDFHMQDNPDAILP